MVRSSAITLSCVLSLLVVGGSGCAVFRAEVGVGVGIGGTVKIPALLHAGAAYSDFIHYGHNYCDGWRAGRTAGTTVDWDVEYTLGIIHCAMSQDEGYLSIRRITDSEHACAGLVPPLLEPDHASSYGLEISVALIFFDIRLGFNPWYWYYDNHWKRHEIEEPVDWDFDRERPGDKEYREAHDFLTQKKYAEALVAIDAAIALLASPLNAYILKGDALQGLGRFKEAITAYDKSLEAMGTLADKQAGAEPWHKKGLALLMLQRWQEGVDAFGEAIRRKPQSASYLGRANAYGALGQAVKALKDADVAIEKNPKHGGSYGIRSIFRAISGDTKGALADYKKLRELAPEFLPTVEPALKKAGITLPE